MNENDSIEKIEQSFLQRGVSTKERLRLLLRLKRLKEKKS